MAIAPSEYFPAPSIPESLPDNVVVGELLDRTSGEWVPHSLISVRAELVEQTFSGLNPFYDEKKDPARGNGYERDIRAGVIAVTVTDEVIACNSLVIVSRNGERTLVSAMMHCNSKKPGLIANAFRRPPDLRLVE